MRFGLRKRGIEMLVVLAVMVLAGAAHAQSTTSTTSHTISFEILAVDGNLLVVREPEGTRELVVPSDFLFNVDGKSLAVTDLKPGMKGTAKVTKTTISHPVYVTNVKNVTVTKTLGGSVIVQYPDGTFKMFSQGDIDQAGVHVFMDGKPLKVEDMREGDKISANFVTMGQPQTLTKTEVDVTLAKAAAAAKATGGAAKATSTPTTTTTATDSSVVTTTETVTPPAADTTAAPAPAPKSSNSMLLWLGLIFVILIIVLILRRRSKR